MMTSRRDAGDLLRFAWASDIHFDKCGNIARQKWADSIVMSGVSVLIVTGDISHNRRILDDLEWIAGAVKPARVRFVLGNHDVWGPGNQVDRDFEDVRDEVRGLCSSRDNGDLVYVHDVEPVDRESQISGHPGFVMLGVDGWWDYRASIPYNKRISGDAYRGSIAQINAAKNARRADLDTWKLRDRIDAAVTRGATDLVILTHVPPYPEVCLYQGAPTAEHSIGMFSNVGLGTMLSDKAAEYSAVRFTVLCGHTHDDAFVQAAPNLQVHVQGAIHGAPAWQPVSFDPLTRVPRVTRPGAWYERDSATIQPRTST